MNGTPRPSLSFYLFITASLIIIWEVVKILAHAARMQAAAAYPIFAWHVPIISKCRQMLYCLQDRDNSDSSVLQLELLLPFSPRNPQLGPSLKYNMPFIMTAVTLSRCSTNILKCGLIAFFCRTSTAQIDQISCMSVSTV